MNFFRNETHSGISAVIYSKEPVLNHPQKLGDDCLLVRNPLADNVLEEGMFPFLNTDE